MSEKGTLFFCAPKGAEPPGSSEDDAVEFFQRIVFGLEPGQGYLVAAFDPIAQDRDILPGGRRFRASAGKACRRADTFRNREP